MVIMARQRNICRLISQSFVDRIFRIPMTVIAMKYSNVMPMNR